MRKKKTIKKIDDEDNKNDDKCEEDLVGEKETINVENAPKIKNEIEEPTNVYDEKQDQGQDEDEEEEKSEVYSRERSEANSYYEWGVPSWYGDEYDEESEEEETEGKPKVVKEYPWTKE